MNHKINKLKTSNFISLLIFFGIMWISNSFAQSHSSGIINFTFKPQDQMTQIAVWIENEGGEYVETIYMTNFIGRRGGGNYTSNLNIDSSDGNRLSALPVWAHKRGVIDITFGIVNYYPPSTSSSSYPDDLDAVTSATPSQTIQTKTWQLIDYPFGEYNIWIEVNKPFDFNQYHNYSSYRGQPSVVWNIKITVSDIADSATVNDYSGYGSPDGSNGDSAPPDETITTATDLLGDLGGFKFKAVYVPVTSSVEDNSSNSSQVSSFSIAQNYPNPFNPSTTIRYHLPQSSSVTLRIYNLSGQVVETLINGYQQKGEHEITWTAKGLASGMYLCKMKAGTFSETRKLVLQR